ncbi:hypothetical protein I6M59_15700 [Shewanella algae]|uniref:hypothetical protein n=1 Tax=Shewanella algae TaxID=38313 RepID=UPI001AADDCB9|nr:hypothetical protein [Shewanella algae]MBO2693169.1 hypothetical protein [Shewanella algae]MDV2964130.1 hypothetical protein [Shewanella algae]QTE89796.1 hypothetical protein JKK33_15645 [Shewanella algae]
MTTNIPSVIYHQLNGIVERPELNNIASIATSVLNQGHVTGIINAFFINTKICVNGVPYIKINGLSTILRTGNSGAERPLIYQGMPGVLSAAQLIEIDGEEHISGPTLRALIDARIAFTDGRTKQYLQIAMQTYERIINLAQVRDLKEVFLDDIRNNRPLLKSQRIAEYGITHCEFSNQPFANRSDVEFAHIESVVTQPLLALNINNGVIIMKNIHRQLTSMGIHGYEGMYNFCLANGYSTAWAD